MEQPLSSKLILHIPNKALDECSGGVYFQASRTSNVDKMVQLTVLMADDNTDFKGCWLASESEQEMEDLCYTGKYYI